MALFEGKKHSTRTPSFRQARRAGRSALMGEAAAPDKFAPEQEALLRSARVVPNEGMMISTSRDGEHPVETKERGLRDVVMVGDTYIAVIDWRIDDNQRGTELCVLPYGSAADNKSSLFLMQTITSGGRDEVVISRDMLEQKGVIDPQVSNGSGEGHVGIVINGGVVMYGDNNSTNGTRLLTGRAMGESQDPGVQAFVADLRANPGYLYGTKTGKETVVPQQ